MSDEMVNGNNCVKSDGRRCKIGKEGRKSVSFKNLQKEIAGKSSRIMKWEVRQGQKSAKDCTQIWGLPSSPSAHPCLSHSTFISRSPCETAFFLTFFSLQLLLLFSLGNILLQFLKLNGLLARQNQTNKQKCGERPVAGLSLSDPFKCRLNRIPFVLWPCSCCSGAKSRSWWSQFATNCLKVYGLMYYQIIFASLRAQTDLPQ